MTHESMIETIEYKLLIIEPQRRHVLLYAAASWQQVPKVRISRLGRHARELQATCRSVWGLHVFVVQFLPCGQEEGSSYVLLELLAPNTNRTFKAVPHRALLRAGVSEEHYTTFVSSLSDSSVHPLSTVGWIDQAIAWVESATTRRLSSKKDIEQFNAGVGFSLLRLQMEDGARYWLKATGHPNSHEFGVTAYLSAQHRASSAYLPHWVAGRGDWNAWLTVEDSVPLSFVPTDAPSALLALSDAVVSFARLQTSTLAEVDALLGLGATDQRLERMRRDAGDVFEFVDRAMSQQTSLKVPPISRERVAELRTLFEEVSQRVENLNLPVGLLHGDLNPGNIVRREHCRFLDWSEAYVGLPFLSLQHLLLLNRVEDTSERRHLDVQLKSLYRDKWSDICDPAKLDAGFRYMPFLAAFSALYARGSRWHDTDQESLHRFPYVRTLARHMDRAARALEKDGAS